MQYEGSMALGVFEDSSYEKASFIMKPGETLIVYTNEVTEAMSADEKILFRRQVDQNCAGMRK